MASTSRGPRADSPSPVADWRPVASSERLALRAQVLRQIRRFFDAREVLEVETPLLGKAGVTDRFLTNISATVELGGEPHRFLLQTSPEYAMKRLLAAGSGSIYQICKAFRDAEAGSSHNPEFTILEWYRVGWDHHRLMDEVDELLSELLGSKIAERLSYQDLFERHYGIDPHRCDVAELERLVSDERTPGADDLNELLSLLVARIEPDLGSERPLFVYDYPASQAALARVTSSRPSRGEAETPKTAGAEQVQVAQRVEVYVEGVELANGFYELQDAEEQRRRFESDQRAREGDGSEQAAIDQRLLAALESGLPECAGIALGIDRLLMVLAGCDSIDQVLAFPIDRA